jgi:hypothetical protein
MGTFEKLTEQDLEDFRRAVATKLYSETGYQQVVDVVEAIVARHTPDVEVVAERLYESFSAYAYGRASIGDWAEVIRKGEAELWRRSARYALGLPVEVLA